MEGIKIIKQPITRLELKKIGEERFGDLVKAAVDIEKGIMAVGGELHSDEETALIEEENSNHEFVWGINLLIEKPIDEIIEFDSMINLKPAFGNRSRGIDDVETKKKVVDVVLKLIKQ